MEESEMDKPEKEADNNAIIDQVHCEEAIAVGEVIEVNSDSEDEDEDQLLTGCEMSKLCAVLEKLCLGSGAKLALDVAQLLRRFLGQLRSIELRNAKQTIG
jgi:hypothetical protein